MFEFSRLKMPERNSSLGQTDFIISKRKDLVKVNIHRRFRKKNVEWRPLVYTS